MAKINLKLITLIPLLNLFTGISWAGKHFVDESIFSSKEKLAIQKIIPNTEKIGRYQLLELTINLLATYDNPFDQEDIDVTAYFFSPSAKEIVIPGFFYQDYIREQIGRTERLTIQGSPCWKVRFASGETGKWEYRIKVQDRSGEVKSNLYTFQIIDLTSSVPIRLSKGNNYLEFETGSPYFGVGESIGWAGRNRQTYDYDYYFGRLAQNKCNYSRVWMVPWHLALEWTNKGWPKGRFWGMGKYCLENAWRLDYIFSLAEEKGIYIMLTLGNYGELMRKRGIWNEQQWENNPYNITNAGPCQEPWDFFANQQAKEHYKKRLRYIIARWGYSCHLLAWELFNEVDAPAEWVREMAEFIKDNDHLGHLVTITFGYPDWSSEHPEGEKIWQLAEVDYTQLHIWGQGKPEDLIEKLIIQVREQINKYKKPCLVAEFGIDSSKDDRFYDEDGKGINLHNGLWAATMSGSFAGAVNWWWDSYVEPNDIYYQYKALVNFVETIDWTQDWRVAEFGPKELADRVRILGLTTADEAIIWVQDKQSNWYTNYQGAESESLEGVSFNLSGMPEGQYWLQYWNTWEGRVIRETEIFSVKNALPIEVSELKRDIAIRVKRADNVDSVGVPEKR